MDLPGGWIVAPGFVDLQVNGYAGAEIGDDPDEIRAVATAITRTGVTAFCPTLVTRSGAGYRRTAAALAATRWPTRGARSLGVHLEGPFLAPTRMGAHPVHRRREPDPAAIDDLLALLRPRIVTLAPELPGGILAVRRIVASGAIVAVGHSEATADTARVAIRAGAQLLTHAFNAMPGIAHREPSALVGFARHPRAYASLIADGVHVDPEICALTARLFGSRLILVSDAVAASGAPPGPYRLGEREIDGDGVRVSAVGRLAGSAVGIDEGVRVLVAAGVPRATALAAASAAPRRLLVLARGLDPGDPADLVILDPLLNPRATIVAGAVVWADPEATALLRS